MISALFDHPAVSKNTVLRKGLAYSLVPLARFCHRLHPTAVHAEAPPIIVNSLPKSGTHLLLQLTRALPNVRYYGGFIATTPSTTLRERSPEDLARHIRAVLPGETLGAHIYYSEVTAEALRDINALHLFIYRDPRDVILSEAHYLAEMNRWHRMYKYFSKLKTTDERLELAINGMDKLYPSCEKRIEPYVGWVAHPDTLAIKYEDLTGPNQALWIKRLAEAYCAKASGTLDVDHIAGLMQAGIDPSKSHTFREGGTAKWRSRYSPEALKRANDKLGPILEKFNYAIE